MKQTTPKNQYEAPGSGWECFRALPIVNRCLGGLSWRNTVQKRKALKTGILSIQVEGDAYRTNGNDLDTNLDQLLFARCHLLTAAGLLNDIENQTTPELSFKREIRAIGQIDRLLASKPDAVALASLEEAAL